jgi:hypothetical protein
MARLPGIALSLIAFALCVTACGGTKQSASTSTATVAPPTTTATAPSTTSSAPVAPGALQGEALSAAAGDIPDNQDFVQYAGPAFSMKVPEGWARRVAANQTTFRDKDNIVRVVVQGAPAPTVSSVTQELARDGNAHVTTAAHAVRVGSTNAVAATYTTTSAPNPVTGKKLTLTVDRYELGHGGKRATVDLGTPVGVDNVDAYRLMIESLRLR